MRGGTEYGSMGSLNIKKAVPRFAVAVLLAVSFLAYRADGAAVAKKKASSPAKAPIEKAPVTANVLGEPLAAGMMGLLRQEVETSLNRRGIEAAFGRFTRYLAYKLTSTVGANTGSEVTGDCRLGWYDHLLRNPLQAPEAAEAFTRQLHQAMLDENTGLSQVAAVACQRMDLGSLAAGGPVAVKSPQDALALLERALIESQQDYARWLSTLTRREVAELSNRLYPIFTGEAENGHTLPNRSSARWLCGLLQKSDRKSLYRAANVLAPLASPRVTGKLAGLTDQGDAVVAGVSGRVVRQVVTSGGVIVIGGKGSNTYRLDEMPDVAAVVDLGGNDVYEEGTVSLRRPVLVVLDLAGDDSYRGTRPGIQGAAVLGISMLVDAAGNDVYRARDVAQGSALAGVGILVDHSGKDDYAAVHRVQGQALGGLGMLVDRGGNDRYHAALWSQGLGNPLGFGILDDLSGDDTYYTGGYHRDSYPETPGYDGWGQGVGAGLRQVANGGIGVMLEGAGDDVYEFDYMAHGGGYWLGVGFARDFGGNDQRLGATRKEYGGGPRQETLFQRFSNGFGCHYALGFCFDDAGDDRYNGTIMGLGMAWDCGVGVLCDFAGKDSYESTGGLTQGTGAQAGLGIIFDYDGADVYRGYGQGYAPSDISYHSLPDCGGNFSYVVDYGGEDSYGCGVKNDTFNRRGAEGGFVIDRPQREPQTAQLGERRVADATPAP